MSSSKTATASESDLLIEGRAGIDPAGTDQARRQFRNTLGHFATGVTAMTTLSAAGKDVGLTVSSFNSLSLDPPLILWSIANSSVYFGEFKIGSFFAVNVLSDRQDDIAKKFGAPGGDRFASIQVYRGLNGVPLLNGCIAYFECLTEARHPGGDHDIIVGRVRRLYDIGNSPLLFHAGSLRSFGDAN